MIDDELKNLGKNLEEYCKKYSIPIEYIFEILNDQKVTPMIRGKATEYEAFSLLNSQLNSSEWSVQKLNLSAQPGMPDEDISITHRRTGKILKAESKNAVRGSMCTGERARIHKVPHFKVKCHRSRSNIALSGSSNDRYAVDVFDVIITNPVNAIIKGRTVGPELELIQDEALLEILYEHYEVSSGVDLLVATRNDWRFAIPSEIGENGFVPRTPYVLLENDPHWLSINQIESKLHEIVRMTARSPSRR
jgi:hypothetical protein